MPIPTNIPWKLIGSAVGILVLIAAFGWLIHSRDGWRDDSRKNEQLYNAEKAAFTTTVANYRTAAVLAAQSDAANVARVKVEQAAVNERTTNEYEARIAAANAQYRRLQQSANPAPSNPGSGRTAPVSGVPQAPSGTTGPATQGELSTDDALTATEQAIQLDELIKAVTAHSNINVNGNR